MKQCRWLFSAILLIAGYGCNQTVPARPPLTQTTMKDIMDSMVDPSADFLFDSSYEIVDERNSATGPSLVCWLENACEVVVDENVPTVMAPHTDEEWQEVRHHAITLVEVPNLLMLPGRKVAEPGERAEYPEVELQPEEIQMLIDDDPASFVELARGLQDAAMMAVNAIDTQDRDLLFTAADEIDRACENCHLRYWYPKDERAAEATSRR